MMPDLMCDCGQSNFQFGGDDVHGMRMAPETRSRDTPRRPQIAHDEFATHRDESRRPHDPVQNARSAFREREHDIVIVTRTDSRKERDTGTRASLDVEIGPQESRPFPLRA